MSTEPESQTKKCLTCRKVKPKTEFAKNKGHGFLNPDCKVCSKEASRRYNNMGGRPRKNTFA
jgi:hypothetical protein